MIKFLTKAKEVVSQNKLQLVFTVNYTEIGFVKLLDDDIKC